MENENEKVEGKKNVSVNAACESAVCPSTGCGSAGCVSPEVAEDVEYESVRCEDAVCTDKPTENQKAEVNLLIAQGGGPTSISNVVLAGIINKAKKNKEIHKMYGLENGLEGMFGKELIDLNKEEDDFVEQLKITPGSILGTSSYKIEGAEKEKEALKFLKDNAIKYFIYIGDQSDMKRLEEISELAKKDEYDLRVLGVPKDIENLIPVTDHCLGYASAAKFIAKSTISAGRALEATKNVHDVVIMEVMGKESGWLAAASSLGRQTIDDAPHLIYLPEIEFDEEKFLEEVKAIHVELGYAFIVISEGIKDADGNLIGAKGPHGPASYLRNYLEKETEFNVQVHHLAGIQRAFAFEPSEVDIKEAFELGEKAIADLEEGWKDIMLTLDRASGDYYIAPGRTFLVEANKETKYVPKHYINLGENFVNNAYFKYGYPLLGDPIPSMARLSMLSLILD